MFKPSRDDVAQFKGSRKEAKGDPSLRKRKAELDVSTFQEMTSKLRTSPSTRSIAAGMKELGATSSGTLLAVDKGTASPTSSFKGKHTQIPLDIKVPAPCPKSRPIQDEATALLANKDLCLSRMTSLPYPADVKLLESVTSKAIGEDILVGLCQVRVPCPFSLSSTPCSSDLS